MVDQDVAALAAQVSAIILNGPATPRISEPLTSLVSSLSTIVPSLPPPPAPPAPPAAASSAAAKPGVSSAMAGAAKSAASSAVGRMGVKGPAAAAKPSPSRAAPVAKPAAAPRAGAAAKPVAGKAGVAGKPGAAAKPGVGAKPAAAPPPPKQAEGSLTNVSLAIEPPVAGQPATLTLSLTSTLPLSPGDSVTLSLPGFTPSAAASGGGSEGVALTVKGSVTVASGTDKEKRDVSLEKAVAVDGGGVKAVLAAAVSGEGQGDAQGGVVPGAGEVFVLEIGGLLVSPRGVRIGDVDVAVITMACAKSNFPEVRLGGGDVSKVPAARLSLETREALAAAGWGVVEGGGEGMLEWGRSDSMQVAKACFEAIIEDLDRLEGEGVREERLRAVCGAGCAIKVVGQKREEGVLRHVLVPSLSEGEGGPEGVKKIGNQVEAALKDVASTGGGVMDVETLSCVARWRVSCDDFKGAEETLAKGTGEVVVRARAKIKEAQYLFLLNTSPEAEKLVRVLGQVYWAMEEAAKASKGEAAGALWVKAASASEDVAHVKRVHGGSSGGGAEAGADQKATDDANMDEIQAILKNRGVFGGVGIEEQIKELEEEYHENINFGLHAQADIVANLLEWYRKYRAKQDRGGDMYESKSAEKTKDDPEIVEALKRASQAYQCALPLLPEGSQQQACNASMARVRYLQRPEPSAVDSVLDALKKAQTAGGEAGGGAGVYAALAAVAKEEAINLPQDPSTMDKLCEAGLKEVSELARRVASGDSSVNQNTSFYSRHPLRLSNPDVVECALGVGTRFAKDGKWADAERCLDVAVDVGRAMINSGVSVGAKAQVKGLIRVARAERVVVLKSLGMIGSCFRECMEMHGEIVEGDGGGRDEGSVDLLIRLSELSVSLCDANASSHQRLGDSLLLGYDHHPRHKRSAEVLERALGCFQRALALEGKPFPALVDGNSPTSPSSSSSSAPTAPAAAVSKPAAPAAAKAPARPAASKAPVGRVGAAAAAAKPGAKPTAAAAAAAAAASPPAAAAAAAAAAKASNGLAAGTNGKVASARLGIAKCKREKAGEDASSHSTEQTDELVSAYKDVISVDKRDVEAYMRIGELLEFKDPKLSGETYATYPLDYSSPNKDDSFIAGEMVRLMMRGKDYKSWKKDSPELLQVAKGLVVIAQVQSLDVISSYVEKLEDVDTMILCEVYALVNKRDIDNETVVEFFKRKGWIIPKKDALRLMNPDGTAAASL